VKHGIRGTDRKYDCKVRDTLENGFVVSTPAELKPAPLKGNTPASDF